MTRAASKARLAPIVVALAGVIMTLMATPGAAAGQEVQGVALDPDGDPLPGVVVALHRIGDMGSGANVASVTTDEAGRFRFEVEVADSALYFAAMRYADAMYIGPPAMAGVERVEDYVLRAEPSAEAGAVASALSRQPGMGMGRGMPAGAVQAPGVGATGQGGTDIALIVVALLALAAAGLFITTAPRYRRHRTRDTLIEVATLENRLAEDPLPDERAELERRRDQLRSRLAPTA
jgi:hypothetical protein